MTKLSNGRKFSATEYKDKNIGVRGKKITPAARRCTNYKMINRNDSGAHRSYTHTHAHPRYGRVAGRFFI